MPLVARPGVARASGRLLDLGEEYQGVAAHWAASSPLCPSEVIVVHGTIRYTGTRRCPRRHCTHRRCPRHRRRSTAHRPPIPVPRPSGHHPSRSHPAVRELKVATEAPAPEGSNGDAAPLSDLVLYSKKLSKVVKQEKEKFEETAGAACARSDVWLFVGTSLFRNVVNNALVLRGHSPTWIQTPLGRHQAFEDFTASEIRADNAEMVAGSCTGVQGQSCNNPSVNPAQALIEDNIRAETIDGGYRFDFDPTWVKPA
ncbi:hypothetical protein B9479_007672 [Cryptococcus floricola]|uniref:Uncharacterized protein n=1 Tax=Cryptococcus floricola TaxID=2591691 RepID=A0A5D3APZ6_9TREE|nr:hypothetical protein B9479_007672 [Cryptococcus floricola]